MFFIYIRIDNRFAPRAETGGHSCCQSSWWPSPMPRKRRFMLRKSRLALSGVVTSGLVLYGAVGSYYALPSIGQRYYGPERTAPGVLALLSPASQDRAAPTTAPKHTLKAAEVLKRGDLLRSENGAYELIHQRDGNVVLNIVCARETTGNCCGRRALPGANSSYSDLSAGWQPGALPAIHAHRRAPARSSGAGPPTANCGSRTTGT